MKLMLFIFLIILNNFDILCQDYKEIRVLICESNQIELKFNGKFKIGDKEVENKRIVFRIENNMIKWDNYSAPDKIFIKNEGGILCLGNYLYNGNFYITISTNRLLLIEETGIENYLKGVLPNEISAKWHIEAIKAQAVAARSFAYYFKTKNIKNLFDLKKDTFSQVYTGITLTNEIFNKAIKDTEDEVIVYENEIIYTPFHSACGGGTEDSKNVWGTSLPYLRYVPCNYCSLSPYYEWSATFTEKDLIEKFYNYNIKKINRIIGEGRSISGRWREIKIIADNGEIVLNSNKFRLILGSDKIRSTRFIIINERGRWTFKGRGWGHGVGLCQWGAKSMAEKGYKYEHILRYYFRGTKIVKISERLRGNNFNLKGEF